mgnify:CR=1 FL=1
MADIKLFPVRNGARVGNIREAAAVVIVGQHTVSSLGESLGEKLEHERRRLNAVHQHNLTKQLSTPTHTTAIHVRAARPLDQKDSTEPSHTEGVRGGKRLRRPGNSLVIEDGLPWECDAFPEVYYGY